MEGSSASVLASMSDDSMSFTQHMDDSDSEEDHEDHEAEGEEHLPGTDSPNPPNSHPVVQDSDADAEVPAKERPQVEQLVSPRTPRASISIHNHVPGPQKTTVVVRDSSYWTYRAMINWVSVQLLKYPTYLTCTQIYTDNIVFAPLSSSFGPAKHADTPLADLTTSSSIHTPAVEERTSFNFPMKPFVVPEAGPVTPQTRKEWVEAWELSNPGRPRPCSAKSIYRLADSA